nr:HNH endonuclease [Bradyrhizobium sp. CCBAU 25338]
MPIRAPRICGCGVRVAAGARCPCQVKRQAEYDARRPSAAARGYDGKWQRESKVFLSLPQNRYCACGCGRVADVVDHKIPHRGNMRLFWDRSNWQPMAASPCHNARKQSHERKEGSLSATLFTNRAIKIDR